ncbi:MAG: rubrerythrin [candidate division Zixibacteria bacterium]|nr:rubrerythrin [candidate division Zixibacteria bacterium]
MDNIDDILDFAIRREEESYDFYMKMADKTQFSGLKEVFKEFAQEEAGHKKKLLEIKAGAKDIPELGQITDLKISDYSVPMKASDDMSYQDTLILAMNREKAAYRLYNDLAARTTDSTAHNLFLVLAQEEAKHKLRFEVEYDENVLKEN